MLGQTPFYYGTIRKYTIALGTLFSDIVIERKDSNKKKAQVIKVPLAYGPKDKWLRRLQENPDLTKQVKMDLPRMSFELTNLQYDPERKVGPNPNYLRDTSSRKVSTPIPWNFDFTLYVVSRNQDDMMNIVEQILPYFSPAVMLNVQIIDDPIQEIQIPLSFHNISMEDNYDNDMEESRIIISTLSFTLKGFLYGPVIEPKIIKRAIADVSGNPDMNGNITSYQAELDPFAETNKPSDPHVIDESWSLQW